MHRAAVPVTEGVTPGEMGKHLSEGCSSGLELKSLLRGTVWAEGGDRRSYGCCDTTAPLWEREGAAVVVFGHGAWLSGDRNRNRAKNV